MSTPTATDDDAPYTLVEIDATAASSQPDPYPLTLTWHNLSVYEATTARPTKHAKATASPADVNVDSVPLLLDDVSGDALPRELLAIVAPTRTTTNALLDALAGRTPAALMPNGHVRVNHAAVRLTPTMLGVVTRETPMYATLTVQEHLQLEATLRLGSRVPLEERAMRVADVIRTTGLTDVASSLIGDGSDHATTGLSRRDRKLLSLATELLTNPSILLLDEPLDGLDAFAADEVVRCLQTLARNGHTVVLTATLNQPTSATFGLVDKLHLLSAHGRSVFHGPPLESLAFFQTHGFVCPALTNPFEFFAHHLKNTETKDANRIHQLVMAWASMEQHAHVAAGTLPTLDAPVLGAPDGLNDPMRLHTNSVTTQLRVLLRRNILRLIHDVPTIRGRLIQSLVIALVIGLIFLRLDMSQSHVQSFSSACFFIVASQFITNALPELASIPKEVALVLRGHRHGHYHALSWYIVKNLSELPFQLLYPLVFLTPAYFLIGFPVDAEVFFTFVLFVCLIVSTSIAIALFAACVAPPTKPGVAFALGIALIAPSMVFGGPFLNRTTVPDYFLWLQQLLPVKYCYHGLMRGFWTHIEAITCAPGAICRATSGRAVLTMNFIKPDAFASDWHLLLAINVTLRVLGGLALWRRAAAAQATTQGRK